MNISIAGMDSLKTHVRVYEDDSLRVVKNKDGDSWIVYNYRDMPDGALILSDGRHQRYGQRFFTQTQAQNAFNQLKSARTTVALKTSELI
jgi:hypothetical protein